MDTGLANEAKRNHHNRQKPFIVQVEEDWAVGGPR